jgi:hypothetical protein
MRVIAADWIGLIPRETAERATASDGLRMFHLMNLGLNESS